MIRIMPVLAEIPKSLALYGHGATEVIYTDNVRADKHELEQAFPSLLDNVTPVPDHSDLEPLSLPSNCLLLSSRQQHRSTQVSTRL